DLQVEALRSGLETIVARHEPLRTTFRDTADKPVQVIALPGRLDLPQIDLSGLPQAARDRVMGQLSRESARRPFDLEHGPLLRLLLLRLTSESHGLVLVFHHIVFDGSSVQVLLRELTALYEAAVHGHSATLPELDLQYADYAAWQRDWLRGDILETQLAWWREQLSGAPPLLALPTDRPRPASPGNAGAVVSLALSNELSRDLETLCRQRHVTLFMGLLTGVLTTLHHLSGQQDLSLGTVTGARDQLEIEDLIGFFVNTLVLRTDLSGDPALHELLERVRTGVLQAYANRDLPFEKLVEELPERDLAHTPFFQVIFSLNDAETLVEHAVGDLTLEPLPIESDLAKFDLTLRAQKTAQGLLLAAGYRTELFDRTTMQRFLTTLEGVLAGAVADPDARLSELETLPKAQRHQLLWEWSDTTTAFPRDEEVHRLFEQQSQRTPEALAIESAEGWVSYGELDRRATLLAHRLRRLGVGFFDIKKRIRFTDTEIERNNTKDGYKKIFKAYDLE
ncbi:MAG: condensation domain-containing protein, partial [Acidobacteriota bacterium]